MGGSQSREGLDLSDSSEYEEEEEDKHTDDASASASASGQQPSTSQTSSATRKTLDELDAKLQSLNQKRVTENGKQERHLVATVGKFSVMWNFQQVKNSAHECYRNQKGLENCYCYKTVLKDESIVESQFMHDRFAVSDSPEAPLVVATPMKVTSFSMSAKR